MNPQLHLKNWVWKHYPQIMDEYLTADDGFGEAMRLLLAP